MNSRHKRTKKSPYGIIDWFTQENRKENKLLILFSCQYRSMVKNHHQFYLLIYFNFTIQQVQRNMVNVVMVHFLLQNFVLCQHPVIYIQLSVWILSIGIFFFEKLQMQNIIDFLFCYLTIHVCVWNDKRWCHLSGITLNVLVSV